MDEINKLVQMFFPYSQSIIIEKAGGMTNKNYLLTIDKKKYIFRIPGSGTNTFICRENEMKNSLIMEQKNISPEIYYFNGKDGIKISNYITGALTFSENTIQNPNNLISAVNLCKQVHESDVIFNNIFNVFDEINKYEYLILKFQNQFSCEYNNLRKAIFKLSDILTKMDIELKPSHNDLVPQNFVLSSSNRLFLVDWEYSGMNDPVWDLSSLILEADLNTNNIKKVLNEYFNEKIPTTVYEKMHMYQILMNFLWALWTDLMKLYGTDFGDYGVVRFNRAKTKMSELNMNEVV